VIKKHWSRNTLNVCASMSVSCHLN
jgi:hypothetical protein